MPKFITEDAKLICKHVNGAVDIQATQHLVTIANRRVLIEADPEGKQIKGCPMYGPAIRPCKLTLAVKVGYSELVRIQGKRVCLDNLCGLTDGVPPGTVDYIVRNPGQSLLTQLP